MAIESNLYALWLNKQTAKGTPASAAAAKRMQQVSGDMAVVRADGSENFSDLDRFSDMTDYVDTLIGEGEIGIEATPEELAYLCYLFFGGETVAGIADPYTHTFTPLAAGGFFFTMWKRVGGSTVVRQKFNDCLATRLTIEGSNQQKVVRATIGVISLDPGQIYTTDPADALPAENPFLFTEGEAAYQINAVAMRGLSQFSASWDEARSPYYGDSVVPHDLVVGNAAITTAGTVLVDQAGKDRYDQEIYGTVAPALDTKPLRVLPNLGAVSHLITKKNAAGPVAPARTLQIDLPLVHWQPDAAIAANPDGGATELALAGSVRKGASPMSSVIVKTGVPAFT